MLPHNMSKFLNAPLILNINNISWKIKFFEIILKKSFFAHISENIKNFSLEFFWKNINISRKLMLYWDDIGKVVFSPYIWRYQYIEKKLVYFRSLLKVDFCTYPRKYQHIEENKVFKHYFKKNRSPTTCQSFWMPP